MKAITVPAPLGTLLTTRQPCEVCDERKGRYWYLDAHHHGPRPMVAQWITVPEPPPDGVIGQRVMFHQDGARLRLRSTAPVPLGCVVGSGVIAECLPIGLVPGCGDFVSHGDGKGRLWIAHENHTFTEITDQLPFNDWSPGRWALRVEQAAATTERCPSCWGHGCMTPCFGAHPDDGEPHDPCPLCGRIGHLDPFRVSGHAGWWDFDPSMIEAQS